MTSWQLQPEGINATIAATEAKIQGFGTATAKLATTVAEPLASGSGFDGIVLSAVSGFLEEQSNGRLAAVDASCRNTLACTAGAANAYLQGDAQMAASTIAAAGTTTKSTF